MNMEQIVHFLKASGWKNTVPKKNFKFWKKHFC